jgi:hypothetical protein
MNDDLEEKYPGAKITKSGAQPAPEGYSSNRIGENKIEMEVPRNRSDARTLAPYEKKMAKMNKSSGGGASGGADMEGGIASMLMRHPNRDYKKGGQVKVFRHHDGIAQRGKTRA